MPRRGDQQADRRMVGAKALQPPGGVAHKPTRAQERRAVQTAGQVLEWLAETVSQSALVRGLAVGDLLVLRVEAAELMDKTVRHRAVGQRRLI